MSAHSKHTPTAQELYEGDQSRLYSGLMNHHSDIESNESKGQVKKIWKITLYLTIVTIIEVVLGLYGHANGMNAAFLITMFLLLTILKAYLIVKVFMHLGDEMNNFVTMILIPLLLFIWFIIAFLADGDFWLHMNTTSPVRQALQ